MFAVGTSIVATLLITIAREFTFRSPPSIVQSLSVHIQSFKRFGKLVIFKDRGDDFRI